MPRPKKKATTTRKPSLRRGRSVPEGYERENRKLSVGLQSKLEVEGKDPEFYYAWIKASSHNGAEIEEKKQRGFFMCTKDEGLSMPNQGVFWSEDLGGIIRIPAGRSTDDYLYLMKQPLAYYEEDQAEKQALVDATEESIVNPRHSDGSYGSVTISRG